jgi:hypothetical protein
VYSTYLGGNNLDEAGGIAVDSSGSAYVTGYSSSTNFPTTAGAFQPTGSGVFVTKLNPQGSALVYSTFVGNGNHWAAPAPNAAGRKGADAACVDRGRRKRDNSQDSKGQPPRLKL